MDEKELKEGIEAFPNEKAQTMSYICGLTNYMHDAGSINAWALGGGNRVKEERETCRREGARKA